MPPNEPIEIHEWMPKDHPMGWGTIESDEYACLIAMFVGNENQRNSPSCTPVERLKISGQIEVDW